MDYIRHLNELGLKTSQSGRTRRERAGRSRDTNFSGGLLGRLAAFAGFDPQNPAQPAPPPLDDSLRGFYRDAPLQPWFFQRQR